MTTDKEVFRDNESKQSTRRPSLRILTTSWDDGDACDFRIARMLSSRKLPATFYVPITGHHSARALTGSDLRDIVSEGFEIGGHGFSHRTLSQCSKEILIQEVETSKLYLEDLTGRPVRMFAYPRGRYSNEAIRQVRNAGYAGARTTEMLARDLRYDPYRMPTTLHVFQHCKSDYIRNTARAMEFGRAWRYVRDFWSVKTWLEMARILFDSVIAEGGIFHLYGHSWEIEEMGLWSDLEAILDYVAGWQDVLYLQNGQILDYRADMPNFALQERCALQG